MIRILLKSKQSSCRGQALVETALVLTLLLMLVGSIIEFAFLMNAYMTIQDAARNAARFSSDSDYEYRDSISRCEDDPTTPAVEVTTQDFYRLTACMARMEMAQARPQVTLTFTSTVDDILVSAFSIAGNDMGITPTVYARHPTSFGETGWSAALEWAGNRHQNSRITSAQIAAKLDRNAPSTGFILVEVIGHYDQKLKLPWITAFLPDPYTLYTFALMPLVSAEPNPD
jgi:Flp pilus assembly protein TadG